MAAGARRRSGRKKGPPARQRNSSLLVSARQLQAPVRRPLQRTAPLTQPEAAPIDAGSPEPAPAGAVAVMASNRPLFTRLTRSQSRPPNGSRLSCGASARGRKRPALRYELVGAQTYGSSDSRPRQLQALVRRHAAHSGYFFVAFRQPSTNAA